MHCRFPWNSWCSLSFPSLLHAGIWVLILAWHNQHTHTLKSLHFTGVGQKEQASGENAHCSVYIHYGYISIHTSIPVYPLHLNSCTLLSSSPFLLLRKSVFFSTQTKLGKPQAISVACPAIYLIPDEVTEYRHFCEYFSPNPFHLQDEKKYAFFADP